MAFARKCVFWTIHAGGGELAVRLEVGKDGEGRLVNYRGDASREMQNVGEKLGKSSEPQHDSLTL